MSRATALHMYTLARPHTEPIVRITNRCTGLDMAEASSVERIFERQSTILDYISSGRIDAAVIEQLVVDNRGVGDETALWDFKRNLPILPAAKVNAFLASQHDAKMHEIVKDCVAFHNSHGGYLVVGVDDSSRNLLGFSSHFDCEDLNRKIQGSTGVSVATSYRIIDHDKAGPARKLGLLYVPKRAENAKPLQFKKAAPATDKGDRAYSQHDFYMRERDNCRKAVTPEDFEFLFGARNLNPALFRTVNLDHNLPPRDYDLKQLYGRDSEITQIWSWLADNFSPVRILCGLGGVGKTSIAYTFSERLTYSAPPYINKLVWLGAKERGYSPLIGKEIELARFDFSNIEELLKRLLSETGCPQEQIPTQPSREELLGLAQQHLGMYNYFLVIDNVDTLPDDEQQEIFHLLMQICAVSKSKAIITARRNLGASRLMYTEIEGLSYDDFDKFVVERCGILKISNSIKSKSKQMKEFYKASGGSPLFALSVLRLVGLGDSIDDAVKSWTGSDGETVRRAAFQREVDRLDAIQSKVLLVLCYLQQASVLEISTILKVNKFQVQNALEILQAFSMTSIDRALPTGAIFKVPPTLALVASLVESRVPDYSAIHQECIEFRDIANNKEPFIADTISKTVAQLRLNDHPEALAITLTAMSIIPDSADLQCLLGRVYSAMNDPKTEDAYQKAHELGCRKRELFDGWIAFRQDRDNWLGVINVAQIGERTLGTSRYSIAKHHAEMMIGDQFSQAGKFSEAENTYDAAIQSIRKSIQQHKGASDRKSLQQLKDSLVIRWLGIIRMLTPKHSDVYRRYIGATHKAVVVYKISNTDVLKYAIGASLDWLDRVSERTTISQTAKEQVETVIRLFSEMNDSIGKRSDLGDEIKSNFGNDARRIIDKGQSLIAS